MGPRLLSFLIDSIMLTILLAVSFVVLFGFNLNVEFEPLGNGPLIHPMQMNWLDWVFTLFFPHGLILIAWYAFGGSPGKLYIRSFIVNNRTGKRPKLWRLVVRYAVICVPYMLVLLTGIGTFFYLYVLYGLLWFNARKRTFHDWVSGTVVVRQIGSDSTPIKFNRELVE